MNPVASQNKIEHEKDYLDNKCTDCPWCGHDRPDHSCGNCYSDMNTGECWKWQGYCSEKCFKYITEELSKIRKEKEDLGIQCKCDDPQCAKCLGINCKDENCPTHAKEAKVVFKNKLDKKETYIKCKKCDTEVHFETQGDLTPCKCGDY
jgi:hypothetical protein